MQTLIVGKAVTGSQRLRVTHRSGLIQRLQTNGIEGTGMSSPGTALENVLYEKKGAIAYATVNRPKVLNALNQRTWEDLRAAFGFARDDADVRGVILTGAGDKAFIAGADIGELARITAVEAERSSSLRTGGPQSRREPGQAGGRGRQWLRARRRLRDGDGLHHSSRRGEREVRTTGSQAGNHSGRRRNTASATAGRQGTCAPAHPVGRNHQRAGGLSDRAG